MKTGYFATRASRITRLRYSNAKGRPLVIDVFTKLRLTKESTRFLNRAEAIVENCGAPLRQAPSTGGYADDPA